MRQQNKCDSEAKLQNNNAMIIKNFLPRGGVKSNKKDKKTCKFASKQLN